MYPMTRGKANDSQYVRECDSLLHHQTHSTLRLRVLMESILLEDEFYNLDVRTVLKLVDGQ